MKKFNFLFSFLLYFLIFGPLISNAYSKEAEKDILEFIIAGLKNRETSLYSIEATFLWEAEIFEINEIKKREILWIKKGEKFRYEVKHLFSKKEGEKIKKLDEIYVFDGEKRVVFQGNKEHAIISRRELLSALRTLTPLTLWLYEVQEKPLSWWLSLPESKISLKGKEKIDGKECYVIEYYYKGSSLDKLWVCPDLNFAPIREEIIAPPDAKAIYFLKDWAKNNDIWFPKTVIYEVWEIPDKLKNRLTFQVKEIKINKDVSEDNFTIDFPPGTSVNDEITGKFYVIPYKN